MVKMVSNMTYWSNFNSRKAQSNKVRILGVWVVFRSKFENGKMRNGFWDELCMDTFWIIKFVSVFFLISDYIRNGNTEGEWEVCRVGKERCIYLKSMGSKSKCTNTHWRIVSGLHLTPPRFVLNSALLPTHFTRTQLKYRKYLTLLN